MDASERRGPELDGTRQEAAAETHANQELELTVQESQAAAAMHGEREAVVGSHAPANEPSDASAG